MLYNSGSLGNQAYHVKFCVQCSRSIQISKYCWNVLRGEHCFGCVGLRRAATVSSTGNLRRQSILRQWRVIKGADERRRWSLAHFFRRRLLQFPFLIFRGERFSPLSSTEARTRGYSIGLRRKRELLLPNRGVDARYLQDVPEDMR